MTTAMTGLKPTPPQIPFFEPIALVSRLTITDLARRKDLYVVLILMGLFLAGSVVVRTVGVESTSAATFLMSAGMSLSQFLAAVLAAVFAGRLFPEEFENRTLMPLLAKPVSRAQVLLGKWAGSLILALFCFALFTGCTLLIVPPTAAQNSIVLAEAVVLQSLALAMLAAFSLFLSLHLPAAAAVVISLTWYACAGTLLPGAGRLLEGLPAGSLLGRLIFCIPNPGLLSFLENFASGTAGPNVSLFSALLVYGVVWTLAILLLSIRRFARMRL